MFLPTIFFKEVFFITNIIHNYVAILKFHWLVLNWSTYLHKRVVPKTSSHVYCYTLAFIHFTDGAFKGEAFSSSVFTILKIKKDLYNEFMKNTGIHPWENHEHQRMLTKLEYQYFKVYSRDTWSNYLRFRIYSTKPLPYLLFSGPFLELSSFLTWWHFHVLHGVYLCYCILD